MPNFDARAEWNTLMNATEEGGALGMDEDYELEANQKNRLAALDVWAEMLKANATERNGAYEDEVMRQDVAMWYGALLSDQSNLVRRVSRPSTTAECMCAETAITNRGSVWLRRSRLHCRTEGE